VHLRRADNTSIPARFSFAQLARDKSITGVLVTDLTSEKSNAELASRIQSLQDEERRMIARELHDSVGQLLSAIAINISRVQKEAANLDPGILKMLNDNAILVEQVSKEIRTISHLLHPPLLDVAGLASAIRWYVDGFSERSRIKVDLEIPPELGRVDSQVEIAVFRIVQESLTNVYRHSGSPSCSVTVSEDQGWLRIKVCDSGRGIPGFRKSDGPSSRGMGLRGMQERLRRLGGVLYIDSNENGTTVTAAVPLSNQPMQMESAS